MKKHILFSTLFFITANLPAAEICLKEFEKFSQSQQLFQKDMREVVSDGHKETVFRNYSNPIGQWREIHRTEGKAPFVLELNDEKIVKHSFNEDCKLVSSDEPLPFILQKVFVTKTPEDWKNEDLRAVVNSGKKGMIYTWSPKFIYSVEWYPQAEKMAHAMGFEFVPVVDPRVSKNEIEAAFKHMQKISNDKRLERTFASWAKPKFHRNLSTDLYMRSGFNHFPVTYIYHHKKIHPRFITGVMTETDFVKMSKDYAGEL